MYIMRTKYMVTKLHVVVGVCDYMISKVCISSNGCGPVILQRPITRILSQICYPCH